MDCLQSGLRNAWNHKLRKLLILPILSFLFYGFLCTVQAQTPMFSNGILGGSNSYPLNTNSSRDLAEK